ncbi:THUMP domain-containing protein 2 isoform 2 [Camelus ferus]|nr:THUMP domain-containing protein 2 isoform 2 [Camelus ferus]
MGENDVIVAKKLKTEQMQEICENKECQLEKQIEEETLEQGHRITKREEFLEDLQNDAVGTRTHSDLTFRVSCRCSGAIAKTFTAQISFTFGNSRIVVLSFLAFSSVQLCVCGLAALLQVLQEVGRVFGIALMKQFGWKADLRNPNLEAGAFVLDPMCGLGTILLEAAKEWPDVYYVGADVSDSQLLGACDNLKAAGLKDKIELIKASVIELPLPSESVDTIISDIPFGKKFKLGEDIKSILQEMERVLHIGGTAVLLLSEDHCRRLRDHGGTSIPLNCREGHAASNQDSLDRMPPFGSLVPVECYKVSLGKTDAFMCKYKKLHSPGP